MTRGMSVEMTFVDEVAPMPYLSTRDGKAITLAAALQAHEDAQREHRQNEALRRLLAAERGRRLEASVPRRNYVAEYRAREAAREAALGAIDSAYDALCDALGVPHLPPRQWVRP